MHMFSRTSVGRTLSPAGSIGDDKGKGGKGERRGRATLSPAGSMGGEGGRLVSEPSSPWEQAAEAAIAAVELEMASVRKAALRLDEGHHSRAPEPPQADLLPSKKGQVAATPSNSSGMFSRPSLPTAPVASIPPPSTMFSRPSLPTAPVVPVPPSSTMFARSSLPLTVAAGGVQSQHPPSLARPSLTRMLSRMTSIARVSSGDYVLLILVFLMST